MRAFNWFGIQSGRSPECQIRQEQSWELEDRFMNEKTVGRFVTINRGCLAMNIEKQHVINVFKAYGYEVINND